MKPSYLYLSLVGLILISFVITASNDLYYFKINKSFEIFSAVFREVTQNYVDEIDPDEMIDDAINGMLESLDPYTVYMDESDNDDLDIMTSGSYNGLGITVSVRDSMLTVVEMEDGFSAQRNGVRVGDRLYKIDSVVVIYKSSDELRKYTRGAPGSMLDLRILRDGLADTLRFSLPREEIKINNVSYSGMINDSIAYIRLDRFSRRSGEEVRTALNELKRKSKIKGIILDLRNNPGGLLDAAVAVSEIFVPTDSPIVTTKGRLNNFKHTYRSMKQPFDLKIPLAVLIDKGSASASEIVAGAIQDLDRGVVVGERSFGKGLVQSVFDLPYEHALKMTTSKYYTPSGRCIQKQDFHNKLKSNIEKSDTMFFTVNGRQVVESEGILPDSTVKDIEYPSFILELFKKDLFFGFASQYAAKVESLPNGFIIDEKILNSFDNYLKSKNFTYSTPFNEKFEELERLAAQEDLSKSISNTINKLKTEIAKVGSNPVKKYSKDISEILDLEIKRRFLTNSEIIAGSLIDDSYVQTAISMLNMKKYKKMLAAADSLGNIKKN